MKGKIIGIISGKGGVGKTTTVANLGVALATEFKRNILVLDGNITTANLGFHLGLTYPPITLHDVLNDNLSLLKAIYVHKSGLRVIPSSLSLDREVSLKPLKKKIEKLKKQYELILIDSAPGLGREAINIMKIADKLLIITIPSFPSITTALKAAELAKEMKIPIIGIILNRVKGKRYELADNEIKDGVEVPVIATIPEDDIIPESIAAKIPVVLYRSRSSISTIFKELAAFLIGEEYRPPGIWDRIKAFFMRR